MKRGKDLTNEKRKLEIEKEQCIYLRDMDALVTWPPLLFTSKRGGYSQPYNL